MGSQFMQQFMAGWQMGQGRNENQRRNQELEMERARQEQMLRQRAEEFELRKEEFAARKKQLAAEEATHKVNAAKEAYDLRTQAQSFQNVPPPTAQDIGIQQTTPQDVGPTLDQINVPQPTMDIPSPMEGQAPIAMPVLTAAQQLAERQRKNREALGLLRDEERTKAEALEPFKVSDDERAARLAAQLAAQRDAAAERRYQARQEAAEKKTKGNATKLRMEYNTQLKPYLQEIDQFNKAKSLASVPDEARSPADDIALVFLFMKAQDPGSTVREGEYATAKNAAGVPDRVRNAYNETLKGTFLTPEQRSAFASSIERNFKAGPGARIDAIQRRYDFLARDAGIDPSLVLMESGILGAGGDGPASDEGGWQTVGGLRVRKKGAR